MPLPTPIPELSADALDLEAACSWIGESVKLDRQTPRTLRLLTQRQACWVPIKGAVLLFGKEQELHFPYVWVQYGRFAATDKANIFDHQGIREPLPTDVESAMLFLKISATGSKDVWSIPLLWLRGAVVCASVCVDYSQRGAPIRIAFFNDRIELESPCILLPGTTVTACARGFLKDWAGGSTGSGALTGSATAHKKSGGLSRPLRQRALKWSRALRRSSCRRRQPNMSSPGTLLSWRSSRSLQSPM
jgi:hypothetical protein